MQSAVSGKRVLIIVHGYNNEFEDITRAYDLIGDIAVIEIPDALSDYGRQIGAALKTPDRSRLDYDSLTKLLKNDDK